MKKTYICDECGKNEATVFYRQTVNGKVTETRLCADCAEKLGVGFDVMTPFSTPFDDVFDKMFFGIPSPAASVLTAPLRCPTCGATIRDIESTSRLGCPDCYTVFEKFIGVDTSKPYKGKKPKNRLEKVKEKISDTISGIKNAKAEKEKTESTEEKISRLRADLKAAVAKEDYETAAKLRDEIKRLGA